MVVTSTRLGFLALAVVTGCGGENGPELVRDPLQLEAVDLTTAVDPFIGTGGTGFATGSTYPGPALPFSMIHLGPDTSNDGAALPAYHCSGYRYEDSHIDGFSLLRMNGTGVPDYGTVAIMPVDGMSDVRRSEDGYRASFDHKNESAEPGYYRVTLDTGMLVEITTDRRSGIFRFTFPDGVQPTVLVDFEHTIGDGTSGGGAATVDRVAGTIDGWMHNNGDFSSRFDGFAVYARLAFDVVPEEMGVWNEDGLSVTLAEADGTDVGAWARFPSGTKTVIGRIGVSFVDEIGAANNLEQEVGGASFEDVRERAKAVWSELLNKTEIFNANEAQAAAVATAIYHAHLMPTLISDVDDRARDTDGNIAAGSGPRYSDFSLWDTYRTLHSWMILSDYPVNADFVSSLLAFGETAGAVPRWALAHADVHSMIGSPGEIVLAESAAKGVSFADEMAAYEMARVTAFAPAPGRIGGRGAIEDYLKYGYVPADGYKGSVSKTQEYAIADAALAAWAERLGRDDDARVLKERASSYKQLFDPGTGFFRGMDRDGSFTRWGGELGQDPQYTEGSAWQYLWLAPHDPVGLADTLGGRERALGRLVAFFDASAEEEPVLGHRSYYWHGNEPGLHTPWLFSIWGERADTGKWTRWAAETFYGTGPEGLPGNDDSGTMSAWLLFASAGIYPIAGFDRYVVGVPLFPRVVIRRQGGDLVIEADADPRDHPVVVSVTLDGEPVAGPYVTHAQLTGEHVLRFSLARER